MIARIDKLLNSRVSKIILGLLLALYLYLMLIAPLAFPINDHMTRVQNLMRTWEVWQSFNAAVIAFIAALVAVYTTKQTEYRAQVKKRGVAKLFLSEGMAACSNYLDRVVTATDNPKFLTGESGRPSINELTRSIERIEDFIALADDQDKDLKDLVLTLLIAIRVNEISLTTIESSIEGRQEYLDIVESFKIEALVLSGSGRANDSKECIKLALDCTHSMKEEYEINKEKLHQVQQNLKKISRCLRAVYLFCISDKPRYIKGMLKNYGYEEDVAVTTFIKQN
ncbi:hypothetical protein [Vibrio agarivorans]|uniref:hypothetical protein n=1 Tax=Vibrio agarivorans TaxID=153622 RepID=UPI00222ED177|nr:hypothetical protein [Vibrio agarivorans]